MSNDIPSSTASIAAIASKQSDDHKDITAIATTPSTSNGSESFDEMFKQALHHKSFNRLNDSLTLLERCRTVQPHNARVIAHISDCLRRLHRTPEALEQIQIALHCDPTDVYANLYSAWIYRRLGKLEEAVAAVKATLKINPKLGEAHGCYGLLLIKMEQFDDARRCVFFFFFF
jgi:tetratricopeptide (TPR) repeat protein